MSEVKQHCTLMLSDSPETDELLIKTYGLTATNKIPVAPGFLWKREFRNEEAHDIYLIRLDNVDLDWFSRFGNDTSLQRVRSAAGAVYERYFIKEDGRHPATIDVEFDVIVVGTSSRLVKIKHRATEPDFDNFIVRTDDKEVK